MKIIEVAQDMQDLRLHLANLPQEEEIRPLTIYLWCYKKEDFIASCRWLSPEKAEVNYQASELSLSETFPGGTRIVVSCPYSVLGKATPPPKIEVPRFTPSPDIAELIHRLTHLAVK